LAETMKEHEPTVCRAHVNITVSGQSIGDLNPAECLPWIPLVD
jgi:hypothetical protein